MPSKALAATRCYTQHDSRCLVLMNATNCHYSSHVPEPTSLCLFIHYLLCFPNKVELVRDMLSAEDLNVGNVSGNKRASVEG